MADTLGRLVATLAQSDESLPPDVVELINRNVRPPQPVTAEQVYVRAMYIVSDQINSFGGRFPADEHDRLAKLLIDSPVMIGHRKDRLPIGRTFHAITVERDNTRWVKSYFYWRRDTAHAEDLAANIDSGICKECSVAFTFSFPECSLCGKDIRLCAHEPLREYESGQVCHFNYRQIDRVLETSLVYRGANPDTSISRELESAEDSRLSELRSCESLESDRAYLIVPRYDSVPVTASLCDNTLRLHTLDGRSLRSFPVTDPSPIHGDENILSGLLIGYNGRLRCSSQQLLAWLSDRSVPLTGVVLNLLPGRFRRLPLPWIVDSHLTVREIPHRVAVPANVPQLARQIMTRDGVELYPADNATALTGYHYHPTSRDLPDGGGYYALGAAAAQPRARQMSTSVGNPPPPMSDAPRGRQTSSSAPSTPRGCGGARQDCDDLVSGPSRATTGTRFLLCDRGDRFEISQCNLDLLKAGRRFVARKRPASSPRRQTNEAGVTGRITTRRSCGSARVYRLAGPLCGTLTCRPIRLGGRDLFAVHFTPDLSEDK